MVSGAPRCRLLLPALAVVLTVFSGCRRGPDAASPDAAEAGLGNAAAAQLALELDEIVAAYRKIIVLTTDEATLPDSDQALVPIVGKILFDRNLPRLELLRERLVHDLDVAAASPVFQPPPALVEAFLDRLESDPGWRDADKLVFRDLVTEIARHLAGRDPESPLGKAFLTRLEEDRKAVDEIQARYDDELAEVFSRIGTRGMTPTREAWEDYVAHLRTLFTARGVLDELRDEVAPFLPASETRGAGSRTLNGRSLPAKTLVLTFDDGPHPRHTKAVLDVLARFGLRSIFFKVGQNVGRIDDEGKVRTTAAADGSLAVRRAGHLVANHSYTHALLPKLSDEDLDRELDFTTRVLEEAVEVHPALFRPPYGALSDKVREKASERDLRIMLWNVDSRDWADPVPKSIAVRVIGEAREQGRGVLLFHDIHARTIEALPLVIEALREEGFRFVLWDGDKVLDDQAEAEETAAPAPAELYGQSFAAVIGINAYAHWPRLAYAAGDAQAVRDLLVERFAFPPENVFLLLDEEATRENILRLLGDTLADPQRVGRDDRVLVFFAGHGATRQLASGRHLGYIVPVEADARSFHGQAISMTQLQDVNEAIPAKHVLYLMDACYGGLALVRGGPQGFDPRQYLREVTSRPARQMLTAGGADEEVADGGPGGHSIFTWTVLEGLRGMADLNGDHHVTAAELFAFTAPRVSGQSRQTPAFGNLVGSSGGEFVFALERGSWSAEGFLTELSRQLDDEALRLEAELARYREEIAAKRRENRERAAELAKMRAAAAEIDEVPIRRTPAEEARDLINEGLVRYREKKLDDALGLFLRAFELQPSNALAANNVGFAYYKLGRYAEACEWYEKTLSLDPERAVAHLNLGEARDKLNQSDKAAAALRRFLELAPEHSGAAGARERLAEIERDPSP